MKAQIALERQLMVIFELILLLVSAAILYTTLTNLEKNQIFAGKAIARELALILNTLFIFPDNIFFYSLNGVSLPIEVEQNTIRAAQQTYPFAPPPDASITANLGNTASIYLYKEGRSIFLTTQPAPRNPYALECPPVNLPETIVLDPSHGFSTARAEFHGGEGDTGPASEKTEAELARSIAQRINAYLPNARSTRALNAPEAKTMQERIDSLPADAAYLGISIGNHSPDKNLLRIFINGQDLSSERSKQSYALACTVLNTLTHEFKTTLTGASIIPINPTRLRQDNPTTHDIDEADIRTALLDKHIGIHVELGNLQQKDNTLIKQHTHTADVLARAVKP